MVFNHSIKVPTQYKKAASVFKTAIIEKKSVKSLVYDERHAKIPNLLALLNKYSQHKNIIEDIIEKTKILTDNPRLDQYLCRVLITELLFGTKNLKGESKPVTCVRGYKDKFEEELKNYDNQEINTNNKTVFTPRYIRVNTNLITIADFIKKLDEEGWKKNDKPYEKYEEYLEIIKSIEEDEYVIDIHMNSIFVFHPKWKAYWASHEYTVAKNIILQDKATCLVAELLNPPKNSIVLDMCAAPGMKTIHLSNIMGNQGTIYAIERSNPRYKTLCKLIEETNSKIVKTFNADALTITKEIAPDVEYILVDPSCSGSGMKGRISLVDDEKNKDRLWKLSCLQGKLLSHAMSEFPKVKKIVYSTCSLYPEENEAVVNHCLEKFPNFKLLSGKKALRRQWKNYGQKYEGVGKNCIYSIPEDDYTDGIFIAIFEKRVLESYDNISLL